MKKHFIWAILYFALFSCKVRPQLNRDVLVNDICSSLKSNIIVELDSAKVFSIFKKHLDPFIQNISYDSANALYQSVYIRLYRECDEFVAISQRLNNNVKKTDWESIEVEPKSEINDSDAGQFFQIRNFKYLETNVDTVNITITDSTWEDNFANGTFSHLSLKKLNKKEFVITFIESNNQIRKNFSKPGDQYRYKILKKNQSDYLMFMQAVGSKLKYTFKLYY